MRHAVTVGLLSVLSCGPAPSTEEDTPARSVSAAIVGGHDAPSDAAVVALALQNDTGTHAFCSGALVGPRTVLTAAHCIRFARGQEADYRVLLGADASRPEQAVAIVRAWIHPGYASSAMQLRRDVALLELGAPMRATPLPLYAGSLDDTGMTVLRGVGFGVDSIGAGGAGQRRQAALDVETLYAEVVETTEQSGQRICFGDSGSPALWRPSDTGEETVVGVASAVLDSECRTGALHTRIDTVRSWIETTAGQWDERFAVGPRARVVPVETPVAATGNEVLPAPPAGTGCASAGPGMGALLILALGGALRRRR